jgi:hypothetical protein
MEKKPAESYSNMEKGTHDWKVGSARKVFMNLGQVLVVKFPPFWVKGVVSKGCGIVTGVLLAWTILVVLVATCDESEEDATLISLGNSEVDTLTAVDTAEAEEDDDEIVEVVKVVKVVD